jgi:hypothetical protein
MVQCILPRSLDKIVPRFLDIYGMASKVFVLHGQEHDRACA